MDIAITEDDRVAIAEVDYIIHHMNEIYLNKIPKKVQNYLTITKSRDVDVYVDPNKPLENQGLKEFTLYFLMILNLKYWCDDQRRKEILSRMEYNQKKVDEKIYDIFDQAENTNLSSDSNETANDKPKEIVKIDQNENDSDVNDEKEVETSEEMTEKPKENFFIRLLNKVKSMIFKNKQN